jgi:hypothetical protein
VLGRLDRHPLLPESMAARTQSLGRELFAALSGRGSAVKAIYQTMLGPYARSLVVGPVLLALSGRTIEAERRRLGRLARTLGGEADAPGASSEAHVDVQRLAGLSKIVALVVDARAHAAVARGTGALRVLPTLHIAMAGLALVATIVHVIYAVRPW